MRKDKKKIFYKKKNKIIIIIIKKELEGVFREEVGGRRRLRRKRRRLVVDVEREREKKCIKTRFLFPFQISRPEWEEEVYSWGDWRDFLLDIKKRTSSIKKNRVGVYRYISSSIEYRKRYI